MNHQADKEKYTFQAPKSQMLDRRGTVRQGEKKKLTRKGSYLTFPSIFS